MATTTHSPAHHSDEIINAHHDLEGKLSLLTVLAEANARFDNDGLNDPELQRAAWRGIEDLTRAALRDAKTIHDEAEALYHFAQQSDVR